MKKQTLLRTMVCLSIISLFTSCKTNNKIHENTSEYLNRVFDESDIPGMSVVLIVDGKATIRNFGYADKDNGELARDETLYQIGSCSKSYTALAIFKLVNEGSLRLDDPVTKYIPWFGVKYKTKPVTVTIKELLNHTSGIPWSTISMIPATEDRDALEKTVRKIAGIELHELPGKQFEYATVNYDILALVIEKIYGDSFENYMQQQVLGPLRLTYTSFGAPVDSSLMSVGYKIAFFKPRKYDAPVYKGNNAAGYVVTNALDMTKWLNYQMALDSTSLTGAILRTQERNETVPPVDNMSYASGWFTSLNGDNLVFHPGLNPNFASFVGFNPKGKYGVAILANSNSANTQVIGRNVLRILSGQEIVDDSNPNGNNDRAYSTVSGIVSVYILLVCSFIVYVLFEIFKKDRKLEGLNLSKVKEAILSFSAVVPFLYGLYIVPNAIAGFTWEPTLVWMPYSFYVMIVLVLASMGITYFSYFLTLCFPSNDKHKGALPKLLLLSALSGIANMILILLVTSAVNSTIEMKFLLFYFGLTLTLYLLGRRFVQIKLIKLTRDLIYDLRVKLIDRIFKTSYQKFEKIDRGRIYTAFNDDVGTIGESTNMLIMLVTNLFTATAAMLYLATLAFWATLLTLLLIGTLSTIYFFVSRSTHHYFDEARDTRNVFMRLLNGLIDGYKELSLHSDKKLEYKQDVADSANEYRQKISIASIRYVRASIVGEIVLILILGAAAFAFPVLFPSIQLGSITMFIITLLYLIGPVNAILQSVPAAMRLGIAWNRVQQFLKEIPVSSEIDLESHQRRQNTVYNFRAENLKFSYDNEGGHQFDVGPINLEVNSGEILFIIGGNGSGKTTVAKLLTGLYKPNEGAVFVNGVEVPFSELGENFSAVFNPLYLFEKLYNINISARSAEISRYLDLLDIKDKVKVLDNGAFSTINLSGGQRKRLALLLCYLEDSPIYLFDEWAADQDPEYRRFFYRTLLPEMRDRGKIVIAITHDDHYFDVADRVVKMNQGKLEDYSFEQRPALDLEVN